MRSMGLFVFLAVMSLLMLIASIVVVPWLVVRMPDDFLVREPPMRTEWGHHHPAIRLLLKGLKNALAYVLIGAGILMLVLPGQGVLTIVVGLMLADFPGKHRLERWLLTRRPVLNTRPAATAPNSLVGCSIDRRS